MEPDELDLVISAYEELLKLPLGSMTRHRVQASLANLRDEIAHQTGRTAEDVQTKFEARSR